MKIFLIYSHPFWDAASFQGLHPVWLSEEVDDAFGPRSRRSSDKWTRGIASFKPVHSHQNALGAYVSGYESIEQLTDEEIVRECTRLIRKLMGNDRIPEPKAILR